jgi:hypothetical protein
MADGTLLDPNRPGVDGVYFAQVNKQLQDLKREQQLIPPNAIPAQPLSAAGGVSGDWYLPVTSATMGYPLGAPWDIVVRRVARSGLFVTFPWRTGAGTTGTVRLSVDGDHVNYPTTASVALGANTSGTVSFSWLHPVALWSFNIHFFVEAARTAGANNVEIGFPQAAIVDPAGCTTRGI